MILNSFHSPRYGSLTFLPYMTFLRGQRMFSTLFTINIANAFVFPISLAKCEALTRFRFQIKHTYWFYQSKTSLLSAATMFGDFNRIHGGFWFSVTRLVEDCHFNHRKKDIEICSNFGRMCTNGKHHAFWITNGLRRWSNRLLPSDYAEGERFFPPPRNNRNIHSTASLQVQRASVAPRSRWRRRLNNFSLILTLVFFFFFFNFQPKATRAGDEKHRIKSTWPYLKRPPFSRSDEWGACMQVMANIAQVERGLVVSHGTNTQAFGSALS